MPRVIVIGGGAAGSMAAIFAASGGAETVLLEGTADGGRKVLISGGGRCNVLPTRVDESRFVSDSSPALVGKMVRAWPLAQQVAFFESELGIPLVAEEPVGKFFPASHRARDVRDGLLRVAVARGARLMVNKRVTDVRPAGSGWIVECVGAPPLEADMVILATGGLSVPNTGSDGFGLRVLASLGHTMHPTYAALTPLTAHAPEFNSLAGISLAVTITARSATRAATATGGFLFTHHGYSGPAVLDVSHVAVRARAEGGAPARLIVQWTTLGDAEWERSLEAQGARTVAAALRAEMPDRLAATLMRFAGVEAARTLAELRRDERRRLIDMLVRGPLPCTGDEGYRKAEVTGGGLSLADVHPRSMESRRHPGLFICGEALDAFGPIGGYNFLWAWATGRAAGLGAAGRGAGGSELRSD